MSFLRYLPSTEFRRFARPRTVYEYGFDKAGAIKQDGSPSEHLLPWEAIDAHAKSFVTGRPCQYIVVGEFVREDGVRFPDLAINPDWMESFSFRRDGKRWVAPE